MEDRAISLNDLKKAIGILKTDCELRITDTDIKIRLFISDLFCEMWKIINELPPVESNDKEMAMQYQRAILTGSKNARLCLNKAKESKG